MLSGYIGRKYSRHRLGLPVPPYSQSFLLLSFPLFAFYLSILSLLSSIHSSDFFTLTLHCLFCCTFYSTPRDGQQSLVAWLERTTYAFCKCWVRALSSSFIHEVLQHEFTGKVIKEISPVTESKQKAIGLFGYK